jgi:DNA repair protein RecN (Recombination protein N)
LAQIASNANNHLKIFKETANNRTTTHAKLLNKQEHIEEVANIISGATVTKNAIKHAQELIESNN